MKFLDWLLNKASPAYAEKLTGGQPYWKGALEERRIKPSAPPQPPAYEPVYGLPAREVEEWLERNPHLLSKYEAELLRRKPIEQLNRGTTS